MNAKPVFRAPQSALTTFPATGSKNTQSLPSAAPMKRMSLAEDAAQIARRAQYEHGTVPRTRLSGSECAAKLRIDIIAALIGPNCRTAKQVADITGFDKADVCRSMRELVMVFRLQRTAIRSYRYFQPHEVPE